MSRQPPAFRGDFAIFRLHRQKSLNDVMAEARRCSRNAARTFGWYRAFDPVSVNGLANRTPVSDESLLRYCP